MYAYSPTEVHAKPCTTTERSGSAVVVIRVVRVICCLVRTPKVCIAGTYRRCPRGSTIDAPDGSVVIERIETRNWRRVEDWFLPRFGLYAHGME